jgi:hypothetical protein
MKQELRMGYKEELKAPAACMPSSTTAPGKPLWVHTYYVF